VNEEGAPFDSGFDDAGPFSDTPGAGGVALDAALREFGPAAFEDLVPRLRALAADLDAAHDAGFVHGRLHPSKIFVTDDATYVMGARVRQSIDASAGDRRWPVLPPYTAPEVVDGGAPAPTADQFSLAAIAYEWMFGRPIAGPADRPLDVRALPNVDRLSLSKAFTRALTREPFRRFASCGDFCDAVAGSSAPSLPLLSPQQDGERAAGAAFAPEDDADDDPVEPFQPEPPADVSPVTAASAAPALSFFKNEADVTAPEPDLDTINPPLTTFTNDPVRAWRSEIAAQPTVPARSERERFSGLALLFAALVGAVAGFAAGYMARPRALQSAPPVASQGAQGAPSTPITPSPESAKSAPAAKSTQSARSEPEPAPRAPSAPSAPRAPEKIGRLLIRSTPSGASVEVDGVARGVTPVALQELDLGAREITVSRPGYVAEERRIVLTKARPSRSVEVRLTVPATAKAPPRPSTPATLGKPAVTTGALAIESRPIGAAVTVNGKPSGTTPVTIDELPPGEYQVTMTLAGHRPFTTTVRVVAGERARAAARLTEQEQE
jgi:hypothetical protein